MPLTKKGNKIMSSMRKEYGEKKAKKVFYASANSGKIKGVHGMKKDKGFYGHFSASAMKDNCIHTTGGTKGVGQHHSGEIYAHESPMNHGMDDNKLNRLMSKHERVKEKY